MLELDLSLSHIHDALVHMLMPSLPVLGWHCHIFHPVLCSCTCLYLPWSLQSPVKSFHLVIYELALIFFVTHKYSKAKPMSPLLLIMFRNSAVPFFFWLYWLSFFLKDTSRIMSCFCDDALHLAACSMFYCMLVYWWSWCIVLITLRMQRRMMQCARHTSIWRHFMRFVYCFAARWSKGSYYLQFLSNQPSILGLLNLNRFLGSQKAFLSPNR